ncbi:hypothetical protein [Streptomyces xiamenensis]|uniref:hypothetical protein n=1 Tax=Streptomyces xiamenensis TaxID=408015 RepID=UPI0035D68AA4
MNDRPSQPPHPSALAAPPSLVSHPGAAAVLQIVGVWELTIPAGAVDDVIRHGHRAAQADPETAALLRVQPGRQMGVHTAAALLAAHHEVEDLTDLGLDIAAHISRISATAGPLEQALIEVDHHVEQPEEW